MLCTPLNRAWVGKLSIKTFLNRELTAAARGSEIKLLSEDDMRKMIHLFKVLLTHTHAHALALTLSLPH